MNGADAIIAAARLAGVEVCFANPGTTEVHLVAAMEAAPTIRPILGLFEGVCTGAADGYARMSGKPALTLLHLGAGLANGVANLHNAKMARVPLLNLVGTHATNHLNNASLLNSDIPAIAKPVSGFVRETRVSREAARDFFAAHISAAEQRQVSTLIIPADAQWESVEALPKLLPTLRRPTFDRSLVQHAAAALKAGTKAAIILGADGLLERGLRAAGRIQRLTGCKILSKRQPARIESAPDLLRVERLGYFPEHFMAQVKDIGSFVLAGTEEPAAIFAYKDGPTHVIPPGRDVCSLTRVEDDVVGALESLANHLSAPDAIFTGAPRPALPTGVLDSSSLGIALASLVPDNAIVVDESITSAPDFFEQAVGRVKMSYLSLTGGAIGIAAPLAVGAAVACPDRPVVVLQGDGSAMYTLQALWTQARECLNVTTIICANQRYRILGVEHRRSNAEVSSAPLTAMMELTNPPLDWTQLANGMGVPASRARNGQELADQFARAVQAPGPHLIELMMP
jgi:acetolactate synthase I/II/III large subunit